MREPKITRMYLDVTVEGDESLVKHVQRRLQQSCNDIHGGTVGLILRDEDEQVVFTVVNGPLTPTIASDLAS